MGGGGVVRAAAKVAGVGVVKAGIRGGPSAVLPAEQSVIRGATRPVSAIASKHDSADVATVPKGSWEVVDDWEFAGGVEEETPPALGGEPIGRLVFDGAPCLEEAKEATVDLTEALEKVYFSSPNATDHGSSVAGKISSLPLLSTSGFLESEDSVSCDPIAVAPPRYAIQAFSLLRESPAAQSVVASIASDPNVWNAVLKNDALIEFLHSQKNNAATEDGESPRSFESPRNFEEFPDATQFEKPGNAFTDFLGDVKGAVVEMVGKVSGLLQNIFGFSAAQNMSGNGKENAGPNWKMETLGASFMGLAVMVIMVIVMKRA